MLSSVLFNTFLGTFWQKTTLFPFFFLDPFPYIYIVSLTAKLDWLVILRMKRKSLVFTVLDFDHYSSCSSIIIYRRQKVSSMPTCFTAFIYHVKLCNVLVFRVRFSKQRIFQWTSKEEEELVWAALSGDRGHLYHFRPRNFQSILSWFYLGAFCALFYMRWGWVAVIVIIISELLELRWCLPHFIIKSSFNFTRYAMRWCIKWKI